MKQFKHALNTQLLTNKTSFISVLIRTPKQFVDQSITLSVFSKVTLLRTNLLQDNFKMSVKFPVTVLFLNSLQKYFLLIDLNKFVKVVYIKLLNYYITSSQAFKKFQIKQTFDRFRLQVARNFLLLSYLKILF